MGMAVCFACGSQKLGALLTCKTCGRTPRTASELAMSLALSEHLASRTQLQKHSHELRNQLTLTVQPAALAQAHSALKDPQLMAMLRSGSGLDSEQQPQSSAGPPVPATQTRPAQVGIPQGGRSSSRVALTALHQNAFSLIGVSTRDDRRRIIEAADEKSLTLDHDACHKARSDLTNPRNRLSCEIAWLPGVSPKKATQLVGRLFEDPMALREDMSLPVLAYLNLMASVFELVDGDHDADDLAEFIQEFASITDALDPEGVLRDINEDRVVSGFPEIKGIELVEAELEQRRRYYRTAIKDALNRLPPERLVKVMTLAVDMATDGGEEHAPALVDDLVDSYEVETKVFLEKEEGNVHKLIKAARDAARSGEPAVKAYVDKLEVVTRNWDSVAQPIQLSAKARGIEHEASLGLGYKIRSLAIDLFNNHDMIHQSQRLMDLLQELFAEIPDISERVEQDVDALADIFHERKQSVAKKAEWDREITYSAEIGVIFKDTLSISPSGVSWKGVGYPLDAITRVRWGGIRNSVNGVPTGTTFTIGFGDARSEVVVELRREEVYSTFIDKLWRAVCVRLLGQVLETVKAGQTIQFGDAVLHDDGITLTKHKFFGANERIKCSWGQVQIWSADGSFCIGSKDDKKTNIALSYIYSANTHILEQVIRMAFKKPGLRRLSELLE